MQTTADQPETKKDAPEADPSVVAASILWCTKIRAWKKRYEKDFKLMRDNMKFAYGLQWDNQKVLDDDRYVANLVNRAVNQKVSTLYAKDPKAIARRRKRLDYALYDGKIESMALVLERAMGSGGTDMEAMATISDYQQGMLWREMIDKVCRTLEIVYQYEVDRQRPGFKAQMKQLVRRVVTCGVAYVTLGFERTNDISLMSSETHSSVAERSKELTALLTKIEDGEIENNSAHMETAKMLAMSLATSMQDPLEQSKLDERLTFDFPTSTSIIPDDQCRCLTGFVGCNSVAREYLLPLDYVNAMFETQISVSGGAIVYDESGLETTVKQENDTSTKTTMVTVWDVQDLRTKSHFIVCDGWKDFLVAPEANEPNLSRFWNIFALTFNDSEVETGLDSSCFPPSDVTMMRSAQKEWNRSRETLRDHRIAKLPRIVGASGVLNEQDVADLKSGDNSVVLLRQVPAGTDINKLLYPLAYPAIDPAVYSTEHLSMDIQQTIGAQSANLGPAQPNVTATVGTIAEQSRMETSSSNVDDLDTMLSDLAQAAGEVLMTEFSPQTVQRIAGRGAIWPDQQRDDFLNEIYLDIVAASAGRPNKAIEVANGERLLPLLMQMGANPQAIIREAIKRLDDQLEPEEFFPVAGLASAGPAGIQSEQAAGAAAMAGPMGAPPTPGQPGPEMRPPAAQGGPPPATQRRNRQKSPPSARGGK